MMRTWVKRFFKAQRDRKLQKLQYTQSQTTTHPIAYGKIYGYEAVSTASHREVKKFHNITTKTYTRSAPPTDRHHYYYYDHYDDGCTSCGGVETTWGGSDSNTGASSSCGGGGGGFSGGDGDCGGGDGGCGGD